MGARAGRSRSAKEGNDSPAWRMQRQRPDPIGLLIQKETQRMPWLIPVRLFSFFRGSAQC